MPTDLLILLSPKNLILFIVIFSRLGGLMTSAPLFSTYPIPPQIKIWFMAFVSFIIFSIIQAKTNFQMPNNAPVLTLLLLKEFLIGYMIGFVANLLFVGIEMASELISIQTGLSSGQALNPVSGDMSPFLSQFYMLMAAMVFISLNAHQWLFSAVYKSFIALPPSYSIVFSAKMIGQIVAMSGQMFTVAMGVALPIYSVLMITDVLLGFTSKMMPQMNIFMLSMPLKIYIGFLLIIMFMQPVCQHVAMLIEKTLTAIMMIF